MSYYGRGGNSYGSSRGKSSFKRRFLYIEFVKVHMEIIELMEIVMNVIDMVEIIYSMTLIHLLSDQYVLVHQ